MLSAHRRALSRRDRVGSTSRAARQERAGDERCALRAALLSALVPGAGQLYLGRRRRGWPMLAFTVAAIAVAGGLWLVEPILVLSWLVQPRILLGLLVLDAALLAFRLFAVVDAYRLGRVARQPVRDLGGRGRRFGVGVVLALLLVVTAVPHVAAGYYDYLTYDLLTEVFPSERESDNARPPRVRRAPARTAPAVSTPGAP